MNILFWTWMGFCAAFLAWAVFQFIRARWVFRVREDILSADLEAYERLPSFETMIAQWWIWDASRFIGAGDSDRRKKVAKEAQSRLRGREIIQRAILNEER